MFGRQLKAIRAILKLRRLIGRHVRIFFKKLASKRAGGALKSGWQWAIFNVAKVLVSRVGGLFRRW